MTARNSTVRDVISHKREEKHGKKSVGHTKWHTKFIENGAERRRILRRGHTVVVGLTCERYCGDGYRSM